MATTYDEEQKEKKQTGPGLQRSGDGDVPPRWAGRRQRRENKTDANVPPDITSNHGSRKKYKSPFIPPTVGGRKGINRIGHGLDLVPGS